MNSFDEIYKVLSQVKTELKKNIFGQDNVLEKILVTILCKGHALITGAPGLAKTTIVKTVAQLLNCEFSRIQFTPDLTPYDILGGETIEFDKNNADIKKIVFSAGPIFSEFILADEINRASPRTQSALLEAMQENQISIAGKSRPLPSSFFVFATQNPIENEGTFPLPEAQLDRFLIEIPIRYPDLESEVKISQMSENKEKINSIQNSKILLNAREQIEKMTIDENLIYAIVRLVRNTRPEDTSLTFVREYFEFGASPRASQSLLISSKALAAVRGDSQVSFEHVKEMAPYVLKHRCIANYKCVAQNIEPTDLINQITKEIIL
jgi:MoxR-like ATPase